MGIHVQSISGHTSILGILADPVDQIRTPELVNAALVERKLFGRYLMLPFHVDPNHLASCVEGLRLTKNFCGAVVTAPHKQNILELLDYVAPEAEQVSACNVIHRDSRGYLSGTMCDGEGFVLGLNQSGYVVTGARCLLVGTGGAGAGIAFSLARRDIESLHIVSRTPARAVELAAKVKHVHRGARIHTGPMDVQTFDLVINVTSLGLGPHDPLPLNIDRLSDNTIVADIVIGGAPTPLLRRAMTLGCPTYSGHEMLAAQIDLMIDYMTGDDPSLRFAERRGNPPQKDRQGAQ